MMRKLMVVVPAAMCAFAAWADFEAEMDGGAETCRITGYSGGAVPEVLVIPAEIGGVPVTEIGGGAFWNENIKELVLPATLKKIGSESFDGCIDLTKVTFADPEKALLVERQPNSFSTDSDWYRAGGLLMDLNSNVFGYWGTPNKVTIPEDAVGISAGAFDGCTTLTIVNLGDKLVSIGDYAFRNCSNLEEVTGGGGLDYKSVGTGVFNGTQFILDTLEEDGVVAVGTTVFGIKDTPQCVIPQGVKGFATGVSFNGLKIYSLIVPTTLEDLADAGYELKNIELRIRGSAECPSPDPELYRGAVFFNILTLENVEEVLNNTFENCTALTDVDLSVVGMEFKVKRIGVCAFYSCTSLSRVRGGSELRYVDLTAFGDTEVYGAATDFVMLDSFLLLDKSSPSDEVVLPSNASAINGVALVKYVDVKKITLFNNQEPYAWDGKGFADGSFNYDVFQYCASLAEFVQPEELDNYAVVDGILYTKDMTTLICCPQRKSGKITVPDTVKIIAPKAFKNCDGITDVIIPEGIEEIGEDAFLDSGVGNEVTINFDANGGTVDLATKAFVIGSRFSALPEARRPGYTFVHWTLNGAAVHEGELVRWVAPQTMVAEWIEGSAGDDEPGVGPGVGPVPQPTKLYDDDAANTDAFDGDLTYIGWLRDANGRITDKVTVKAGKPRDGASKLTVTVLSVATGRKRTSKNIMAKVSGGVSRVELPGIGWVTLGGKRLTSDSGLLQAGVDGAKAKDRKFKKTATDALAKRSGRWDFAYEMGAGFAAFTVSIDKGKAKFVGYLPNGAKISSSVNGVLGQDLERVAYPLVYSKKGVSIGLVFWVYGDGLAAISDTAAAPVLGLPGAFAAGSHTLAFDKVTSRFEVNAKGRWNFGRHSRKSAAGQDQNPYEIDLVFRKNDGTVKGTLVYPAGSDTTYSVNGVIIQSAKGPRFYGSGSVKKIGASIKVTAE